VKGCDPVLHAAASSNQMAERCVLGHRHRVILLLMLMLMLILMLQMMLLFTLQVDLLTFH
jgi:hypothetical protein